MFTFGLAQTDHITYAASNVLRVVVYIVVRPAEIIVRKKGIFAMRERDLIFKLLRPDR